MFLFFNSITLLSAIAIFLILNRSGQVSPFGTNKMTSLDRDQEFQIVAEEEDEDIEAYDVADNNADDA